MLHDLLFSPNFIRVNKSRRMRWVGRAARTGERTGVCRVLVGKLVEKDHLEDLGLDGSIILKLFFKK
jgi:hypothetical protein